MESPLNVDVALLIRSGDLVGAEGLVRYCCWEWKWEGEGEWMGAGWRGGEGGREVREGEREEEGTGRRKEVGWREGEREGERRREGWGPEGKPRGKEGEGGRA